MIEAGLALILVVLAMFDSWLTAKRIRRYGRAVELNGAIRRLAKWLGPEVGAGVGIFFPTLCLIDLCVLFHLTWVLGVLVGARGRFFYTQLQSLQFEKQVTELAARLKAASTSPDPAPPSSGAPSHDVEHDKRPGTLS